MMVEGCIASEVFLIFTTRLCQFFQSVLSVSLFSDEPEVFLPKYSQMAILHAPHFRRVVNPENPICSTDKCLAILCRVALRVIAYVYSISVRKDQSVIVPGEITYTCIIGCVTHVYISTK